jgi:hypothetical protein
MSDAAPAEGDHSVELVVEVLDDLEHGYVLAMAEPGSEPGDAPEVERVAGIVQEGVNLAGRIYRMDALERWSAGQLPSRMLVTLGFERN